ncbi:MAG: primosomal protein N' [Candidatus Tenebribacter davisii]|nr:primosomal protein N' [Candidatus Tenebribacter davisii]
MKYYQIALPINISKLYIYKSGEEIKAGCRVLVSFNNTFHTGIIWQEIHEIDEKIKYKDILEIVDDEPRISRELLDLALWISRYYHCSLGQALSAMLPSAFNIQLQRKIRLTNNNNNKSENKIIQQIVEELTNEWYDITKLKEKLQVKTSKFNTIIEQMEDNGIIEIQRVFDEKIKKKFANFLVLTKIDTIPSLTAKQTEAYQYMNSISSDFPLARIADKFSYAIVKALRNKELLTIEAREVRKQYFTFPEKHAKKDIKLTSEQEEAISAIGKYVESGKFHPFLLFGITGSGKTEVYIEVIKRALKKSKTTLMLVPEIALTPQMVDKFFNAFGEDIAILHSHLNDRQRWEQWNKIKSGRSKIVIGARSAIFAPLENIGVIIVDEEHETTYKQENIPRYNGRDISILRAKMNNAVVVLGSATPSLESWNNANADKFTLLKLSHRPLSYQLPSIDIIDMKKEPDPKLLLSVILKKKIEEKLKLGQQIILLQNRRGHSSFVQCISCGKLFECPHCDISMNFHSSSQELICHYCGYKTKMPRKCNECGSYMFAFGASGTQQIEKQLKILFPTARILRMDSDSAGKKDSYDSMFRRMREGTVDILLGTQMIAKGLDFENVTLVGVISADIGLNIPDFRAAERTFQLLTQVAGRSGRGEKSGEVIIQTYNPEHYSITNALKQNFESFAEMEMDMRKHLKYPPEYKLARFVFSHKNEQYLKERINKNTQVINELKKLFKPEQLTILGPIDAPMVKIQNNYRYHLILKADSVKIVSAAVIFLKENLKMGSTIKQVIDIDPYSLM